VTETFLTKISLKYIHHKNKFIYDFYNATVYDFVRFSYTLATDFPISYDNVHNNKYPQDHLMH